MKMKIKEILTNNLIFKLCSIVGAFLIWIIVFFSVDPQVEVTLQIPIDYQNEQALEENNLYLNPKSRKNTIDIVVTCRSTKQDQISPSLFKAESDLSKRYGDDELNKSVKVEVTLVGSKINSPVESWRYSSAGQYIDISLDNIITRSLDIDIEKTGELLEGYQLSETGLVLSPSTIQLTGPSSSLQNVSRVRVTVAMNELSEDVTSMTAIPCFMDANGKTIALDSAVKCSATEVGVSWQLLRAQSLGISYSITGTAAEGYRYSGVEIKPSSVSVVGLKAALVGAQNIVIPGEVLNIEGATENQIFEIDINQYLPDGVTLYNPENNIITVTVKVERLSEKRYRVPVSNITLENKNEEYEYDWGSDTLSVILIGFDEDLSEYGAEQIYGTLDVAGLEPGSYSISPTMIIQDGFSLKAEPIAYLTVSVFGEEETSSEPESREETDSESSTEDLDMSDNNELDNQVVPSEEDNIEMPSSEDIQSLAQ